MSFHSILRYPGGKGRLGPWMAWLLRHNKISGGTFVEPYAGGAGSALYLLKNQYVRKIIINDVDPMVYAFWWSVLNKTSEFIELVERTPVSIETWKRQRDVVANYKSSTVLDLGYATFFLNRTNRSGILGGGVIGGQSQLGRYKIDARFNKESLKCRIESIARLRRRITLENADALDFVSGIEPLVEKKSLVYFDPPYYKKGSQLYRNYYTHEDHEAVARCLAGANFPWIVTYDNCEEIEKLYKRFARQDFTLTYSTGTRRPRGTEIIVYNLVSPPAPPILSRTPGPFPRSWCD